MKTLASYTASTATAAKQAVSTAIEIYNDESINSTTFSGAIDIVVISHENRNDLVLIQRNQSDPFSGGLTDKSLQHHNDYHDENIIDDMGLDMMDLGYESDHVDEKAPVNPHDDLFDSPPPQPQSKPQSKPQSQSQSQPSTIENIDNTNNTNNINDTTNTTNINAPNQTIDASQPYTTNNKEAKETDTNANKSDPVDSNSPAKLDVVTTDDNSNQLNVNDSVNNNSNDNVNDAPSVSVNENTNNIENMVKDDSTGDNATEPTSNKTEMTNEPLNNSNNETSATSATTAVNKDTTDNKSVKRATSRKNMKSGPRLSRASSRSNRSNRSSKGRSPRRKNSHSVEPFEQKKKFTINPKHPGYYNLKLGMQEERKKRMDEWREQIRQEQIAREARIAAREAKRAAKKAKEKEEKLRKKLEAKQRKEQLALKAKQEQELLKQQESKQQENQVQQIQQNQEEIAPILVKESSTEEIATQNDETATVATDNTENTENTENTSNTTNATNISNTSNNTTSNDAAVPQDSQNVMTESPDITTMDTSEEDDIKTSQYLTEPTDSLDIPPEDRDIKEEELSEEDRNFYISTPFHVRFGKDIALRVHKLPVLIKVNNEINDQVAMILNKQGIGEFIDYNDLKSIGSSFISGIISIESTRDANNNNPLSLGNNLSNVSNGSSGSNDGDNDINNNSNNNNNNNSEQRIRKRDQLMAFMETGVQAGVSYFTRLSSPKAEDSMNFKDDINSDTRSDISITSSIMENVDYNEINNVPSSDMLHKLNLKFGLNKIEFLIAVPSNKNSNGSQYKVKRLKCNLFLWSSKQLCNGKKRIVISDIDGTITKSLVGGQVSQIMPNVNFNMGFGYDGGIHENLVNLYKKLNKNGYEIIYLSARSIGQSNITRKYLFKNCDLPLGPVLVSPNTMRHSIYRELIQNRPQDFKIPTLVNLFYSMTLQMDKELIDDSIDGNSGNNNDNNNINKENEDNPFYAGIGKRISDAESYHAVNIDSKNIYLIDKNAKQLIEEQSGITAEYNDVLRLKVNYIENYKQILDKVDTLFPLCE